MGSPTPDTIKRLGAAVKFFEDRPRNLAVAQGQSNGVQQRSALEFKVTTAITAGSMPTFGYGYGVLQNFDFASKTCSDSSYTDVLLLNKTDKRIAIGAYVTCVFMYGCWVVAVPDSCSHLSGGS